MIDAARNGHLDVIKCLLEYGANINAVDENGVIFCNICLQFLLVLRGTQYCICNSECKFSISRAVST